MAGEFFWVDVMTSDVAAATAFYTEVVGWGAEAMEGDMPYTVFTVDGVGVAGLMPIPAEVVDHGGGPAWLGYVAVDDVDAAVAKLEAAGGTLHRGPVTVPDTIRFAVVSDPQGAVFYLGKGLSASPPRNPPPGAPGTLGWCELYAADGASAFAFYETMFGWTKSRDLEMGPMGVYRIFSTGAGDAGGMMTKPPQVPRPGWGYYFNVEAIDAAAARVKEAGGTVMMGPQEVPGGQWIVQCVDPQGARFALVAPAR